MSWLQVQAAESSDAGKRGTTNEMKGKNALQKDEIVLENNSTAQHTEYENDTKAEV